MLKPCPGAKNKPGNLMYYYAHWPPFVSELCCFSQIWMICCCPDSWSGHCEGCEDLSWPLVCPRSDPSAVVVATDAAARGLDIPNVAHVVQADFAASAVSFLHRVHPTYSLQSEPPGSALLGASPQDCQYVEPCDSASAFSTWVACGWKLNSFQASQLLPHVVFTRLPSMRLH